MDFDAVGGRLHNGQYHNGDPAQGILPSFDTALWMNSVTLSFRNIITAAGLTPDINDPTLTLQAIQALSQTAINAIVPVGSLLPSYSPVPPAPNFFRPNGAELSRAAYPVLWDFADSNGLVDGVFFGPGDGVNTFTIPDDNGLHYRQWDESGLIDVGRLFGSYQADMVGPHTHPSQTTYLIVQGNDNIGAGTTFERVNGSISPNDGIENRVKNRAITYWLRAF